MLVLPLRAIKIEDIESETELSLASKTFSPDNDGFEDALSLNYRFNQAGLVANSAIYNDRGVLIKRIAKNLTLATSGTLTWDGLDENSSKAAVGIYIVYFEVFDLNGKVRKYRKSCVLAAKL